MARRSRTARQPLGTPDLYAGLDYDASETWNAPAQRAARVAAPIREALAVQARVDAAQMIRIAGFAADIQAATEIELAQYGLPDSQYVEAVHGHVDRELAMLLGCTEAWAGTLIELAHALAERLPETLALLGEGRIDLHRARILATETVNVPAPVMARIERLLLPQFDTGPWAGPAPTAWRYTIRRQIARLAPAALAEQTKEAVRDRAVRTWSLGDGTSALEIIGTDLAVAHAYASLTAQARAVQADQLNSGQPELTIDQARADTALNLLTHPHARLATSDDGAPGAGDDADGRGLVLPGQERELGLVMHLDTLLGDGPAAGDPGQVRGTGRPYAIDAGTARAEATRISGDGASTVALLVDDNGTLQHLVRVGPAPAGPWTRESLVAAVKAKAGHLPKLATATYEPTTAIIEHVRAAHPTCSGHYNCGRQAKHADIDHDTPWPRGPTAAENLAPRCRGFHNDKTRRLYCTELQPDGATRTTSRISRTSTYTRPEPLPGYAQGEAHATSTSW